MKTDCAHTLVLDDYADEPLPGGYEELASVEEILSEIRAGHGIRMGTIADLVSYRIERNL